MGAFQQKYIPTVPKAAGLRLKGLYHEIKIHLIITIISLKWDPYEIKIHLIIAKSSNLDSSIKNIIIILNLLTP